MDEPDELHQMSDGIISTPIPPDYEKMLRKTLSEIWGGVCSHLADLQTHIETTMLSDEPEDRQWNSQIYAGHYNAVYKLCSGHDCIYFEKMLYHCYQKHMDVYMARLLPLVEQREGEQMTLFIIKLWRCFKEVYVQYCQKLMRYLDRYYVRNENLPDLKTIAYRKFRVKIYGRVSEKLNGMLIEKIQRDRIDRVDTERDVVRDGVLMLLDMDPETYRGLFEKALLDKSRVYFANLSKRWLLEGTIVDYFANARRDVLREEDLVKKVFNVRSQERLMAVCLDEFLKQRMDRLLGEEFTQLIRDREFRELNMIYDLMRRLKEEGTQPVATIFGKYCVEVGSDLYQRHLESARIEESFEKMTNRLTETFVDELLSLRHQFHEIVEGPFNNDGLCVKSFTNALVEFSNKPFVRDASKTELKPPQLFAFYCDKLIQKNVDDLDDKIETAVEFVQFFREKDLFITEYRRLLAMRLLSPQSRDEAEKTFVGKIKFRYGGVSDTYKLTKMLTDKSSSEGMREKFRTYVEERSLEVPFDIDMTVLTRGTWPMEVRFEMQVDQSFLDAQKLFSDFYTDLHPRRELQWLYDHCTVRLLGRFPRGEKQINLTTFQAVILLLFNDAQKLTFDELVGLTKISQRDMIRDLVALCSPRHRLLRRDTSQTGAKVWWKNRSTSFSVNQRFRHRQQRVTIKAPRMTEKTTRVTQESVMKDRSWAIDAAIVRIMKARRVMKMQQVVQETIKQIHVFHPTPKFIKQRIEALIETEYIKRSDSDVRVLEYLA